MNSLTDRHDSEVLTAPGFADVIRRLTDLNLEFRARVSDGDWLAAASIERTRFQTLQHLLERPISNGDRQQLVQLLRELLGSDRALLDELQTAREACLHELADLRRGQTARQGYAAYALNIPGRLQ